MPTYGAAAFDTLTDREGRVPYLARDARVTVTPIPYAGADHVQFARAGSPTLTLPIATDDAGYHSLMAYLGDGVPRTLVDPFGWGESLDGMCLTGLEGQRLAWAADWEAQATWIQVGAPA